jgi:hypothetical protein
LTAPFQVHGVDAAGKMIIRRQLERRHVLPFFERLGTRFGNRARGLQDAETTPKLSAQWFREAARRNAMV